IYDRPSALAMLSIHLYRDPRAHRSFPTRRSSDLRLEDAAEAQVLADEPVQARQADARQADEDEQHRHQRQLRRHAAVVLEQPRVDRKSTRLNSSHVEISYAVFCL